MNSFLARIALSMIVFMETSTAQAAVDSYRYAHVTISTPWYIFIFLLAGVFAPFILMAILAWRVAMRKSEAEASDAEQKPSAK